MARHIAIVEDEATIRHNYEDALRRYGYQVSGYADRDSALAALKRRLPDLVIIDVGLGDEVEGGFDLCRELRGLSRSLPIIFLTARDSDLDVISGLRLGADDYLTKDISLQHLVARVVALFRRVEALSGGAREEQLLERGPLKFSVDRMEVSWRDTAGAADRDRILDPALADSPSRPCAYASATDGRRQRAGRRPDHHQPHQAHPPQVRQRRSRIRSARHRVRRGLPLEAPGFGRARPR